MRDPEMLDAGDHLAIIGMSARLPGAPTVDAYWDNLRAGQESVSFFSRDQAILAGIQPTTAADPAFVRARAVLPGVDLFDALFFGYSPREAETMDPQQRFFLECAWTAIESAGYSPSRFNGRIGVFGSSSMSSYLFNNLSSQSDVLDIFQALIGNDRNHLTTRVSYKLDLRGPSLNIQTACSASLVAFHCACQSLLNGECDVALAGGVSISVPQETGHYYQDGGIYSPDGHCRAFDRRAQGIVGGNGVGIVVVRRLADALAAGDHIRAVVLGSATNNDGSAKVGYTAPSVQGQASVIGEALAIAGIDPETIAYVEAHGTGTNLGDPIELAALTQVYRAHTDARQFCGIGSVKSNIGHLDAAAGVAGLIKTVLALEHGELPPTLHVSEPNPAIDFERSPFYVNAELRPWPTGNQPRRAGVSAFGLGGANAHAILEQAPEMAPTDESRPWQLLLLSARTPTALERATDNLAGFLQDHPEQDLADAAYVYQVGKTRFNHRRALVCRNGDDGAAALERRTPGRVFSTTEDADERPVAFLLPGLGDHYVGMARDLYAREPVFRAALDRCLELLAPLLGCNPRELLYPPRSDTERPRPGAEPTAPRLDLQRLLGRGRGAEPVRAAWLDQAALAQPIQFAVEYAIAQLWLAWGVRPTALLGYSLGEYVAACLAGVFALEDALRLVSRRGQLIDALPIGRLLAVPLSRPAVQSLLGDDLSITGVNGPELCTVGGPEPAIDALEQELGRRGLASRRVPAARAFHSRMLQPIAAALTEEVRGVQLAAPTIPYVSNVTGTWITAEQATDPSYWARHACEPVQFAAGLATLAAEPARVLLEVGPGRTLTSLALQQSPADQVALASVRPGSEVEDDQAFMLNSLGRLWMAGVTIDWEGFYGAERRRRIPVPTYPFEHQRYWIEPRRAASASAAPGRIQRQDDMAEWFAVPGWKRAVRAATADAGHCRWLVLADESGPGNGVAEQLRAMGEPVVVARPAASFVQLDDDTYGCRPESQADWRALFDCLVLDGNLPDRIVHLWNSARETGSARGAGWPTASAALRTGFASLVSLSQELARRGTADAAEIVVVTRGSQAVESADVVEPLSTPVLGLLTVLSQEYPNLRCRAIDVVPTASDSAASDPLVASLGTELGSPSDDPLVASLGTELGSPSDDQLVASLVAELRCQSEDPLVALRGAHRWVPTYDPVRLSAETTGVRPLRQGGAYLVVGSLGRVGLALADYLGGLDGARLAVVGRAGLPPRERWLADVESAAVTDETRHKLRTLLHIETNGADLLSIDADPASQDELVAAVEQVVARFGRLDGVVYAAGAAGADAIRAVAALDADEALRQLERKALELHAFERALHGRPLDFCVLVSSLAPVLGGLGFGVHAAVHQLVDAFAERNASWLSVNWNWPDWQGAPVGTSLANGTNGFGRSVSALEISDAEGVETFRRVLGLAGVTRVVVSSGNLQARLDQWIQVGACAAGGGPPPPPAQATLRRYDRPSLTNTFVAPESELERRVAEVWQELLGIEQVGAEDSFFELGGHSLLGTQLIARLRGAFQIDLPIQALFEAPTVRGLAGLIEQLHTPVGIASEPAGVAEPATVLR